MGASRTPVPVSSPAARGGQLSRRAPTRWQGLGRGRLWRITALLLEISLEMPLRTLRAPPCHSLHVPLLAPSLPSLEAAGLWVLAPPVAGDRRPWLHLAEPRSSCRQMVAG